MAKHEQSRNLSAKNKWEKCRRKIEYLQRLNKTIIVFSLIQRNQNNSRGDGLAQTDPCSHASTWMQCFTPQTPCLILQIPPAISHSTLAVIATYITTLTC